MFKFSTNTLKNTLRKGWNIPLERLCFLSMLLLLINLIIVIRYSYGLPDLQIQRLQNIQNIAARILAESKRNSHITPILKHLHWLPVLFRIQFKILAYHGVAPGYLCELITKHHAVRALFSNDMMLLGESKIRGKTYGQERLSMRPHMDGISYHCLLEKVLIFKLLNLVLKHIYLDWPFWHPRLFI